jgi:hypothetical protein
MERGRAIGPLGTLARVAVGLGLVALEVALGALEWTETALGLVGFPAVLLLAQLVRLRWSRGPLRATGPAGLLLNCAILAVLLVAPMTRDATVLWLGASMLVAAWRGDAGCESLALSNWLLRRDDQVGCLLFAPLDELEARLGGEALGGPAR